MVAFLFLFLTSSFADTNGGFIINNHNLIGDKAVNKINEIGKELKEKTGVSVYAIGDTTIGNLSIEDYMNNHTKEFDTPYALLLIISEDKVVDILYYPDDMSSRFEKDKILSPFPITGGTVLPLLGDKKKDNDKYTAAMLNGYADLTDQIASSYNIKLENSIGNVNKSTLNFLRLLIYSFIVVVIAIYITKRIKSKNATKK